MKWWMERSGDVIADLADCERGSRPLALIVDDDPGTRHLIGEALECAGLAVEEAEDGEQAVSAFSRLAPDIVLLDVVMPCMNGFMACMALRGLPEGEQTPIVMMTGFDDINSINRSYEAGATDFITKPISGILLGHRVRYLLRASRAMQALDRSEQHLRRLIQERETLAQDLHDGIIQTLFAIGLRIEDCERLVEEEDSGKVVSQLSAAVTGLNAVIAEVRHHIMGLTPGVTDNMRRSGEAD